MKSSSYISPNPNSSEQIYFQEEDYGMKISVIDHMHNTATIWIPTDAWNRILRELSAEQKSQLSREFTALIAKRESEEFHKSGANGMVEGDTVKCDITGKIGIVHEFFQDGDAYVTWDDGTDECVKWNYLSKVHQARYEK